MSWTKIFRSHHTEWLESQFEELKKTHADQLSRAIQENKELRDELARTRLYLSPGVASVQLGPDNSPPPPSSLGAEYVGTPWQRLQAKELAKELASKGESNAIREGRNAASLDGESKPA
jgi:hypothetical protein